MTDQLGGKAASPPPTVTLLLRPEWGGRARHKDLEIPQPRWVCMVCLCVCVCVCSVVSNSLWAPQAPLSMRFSRQEYWSGLPCPPPAHLSGPGIKPALLHLLHWQADSLPLNHLGSPDRNAIVVSSLSCVWVFATPWTAACQDSLPITISRSLLKLVSIESVMPTNHLILCHPLLPPPSIFPSIRVFSNKLALRIRWPKHWNFSISPSNEYSGLISFSIYWFDLLAVQGTVKSLLWYHSSKTSILLCLAFFMVQLLYPYMTTGKIIALTIRTFVGKVMSLLFNILSRLAIAFLPRSKRLLISWLQSPSTGF